MHTHGIYGSLHLTFLLTALGHLNRVMDPTDEDPGYMIKFKDAFSKEQDTRKATIAIRWLKVATALNPRPLWLENSRQQNFLFYKVDSEVDEPPAKKRFLPLCSSYYDSDKEELRSVVHCKVEPCVDITKCSLEWWAAHAGAYGQLSCLAPKYLANPATFVPCERLFSLAGNIIQKKRAALNLDIANLFEQLAQG